MKHLQKLVTLLLTLALVLSLSAAGFAATVTPTGLNGPASITVTLPEGVTASNTYEIYQVFNATTNGSSISYTLLDGKTSAPTGFTVDTAGNVTYSGSSTGISLTSEDIAAIAAYVAGSDPIATVVTAEKETSFTVTGLPYGYYYITTTTGTVVTVDSTHKNATVSDKNTAPELDKTITGADSMDEAGKNAIAQVGKNVGYSVTITVGKGAENYVFHDQMSPGLSYNGDVKITVDGTEVAASNYSKATAGGDTITIAFDNTYIASQDAGTKILISYTATVTSDALTVDAANNTAWLDYGDENAANSTPTQETKVYNAKFTVTKQDGSKNPLKGAGFILQNADGKYYQYTAATETTPATVAWVDSIANATEYVSDDYGAVAPFTGLANGTYTLIENTVPAGYNKADDVSFTIAGADFAQNNLEQTATVTNNAGSALPSTGGMGTQLFYCIGGILMLSAVIALVAKKRMGSAD